MSEKLPG